MYRRYFLNMLLLLTIICTTCSPEAAGTDLDGLRFKSDVSFVISSLEKRSKLNPAEHFLLAESYYKKSDYKKALYNYAASAYRNRPVKELKLYAQPIHSFLKRSFFKSDYHGAASYMIGKIFYSYKEYDYVIRFCDNVPADDPALYFEAVKLAMLAYSQMEQYDKAVEYSYKIDSVVNNNDFKKIIDIQRASLFAKSGDYEKAKKLYLEIILDNNSSWHAQTSAGQIAALFEQNSITLSDSERAQVIEPLLASGNLDEAKKIASVSSSSFDNDYAIMLVHLYDKKASKVKEIRQKYQKMKVQYGKMLSAEADYLYGRSPASAISLYVKLIELDQESELQFSRVCRYLYKRGRSNTKSYLKKFRKKYPDSDSAKLFEWYEARLSIVDDNFKEALPVLKNIAEDTSHQYYGNALYWLYYHHREKDSDIAFDYFRKGVVYSPDSWYMWMLADKLKKDFSVDKLEKSFSEAISLTDYESALFAHFMLYVLQRDNAKKERRLELIKTAGIYPYTVLDDFILSVKNEGLTKQMELYFDAGYEDGITGLLHYMDESEDNRKLKYLLLSRFGDETSHYHYAFLGTIRLLREFGIGEEITLLEDRLVKRLFPKAYSEIVKKTGKNYPKLDHNMIYSVMKSESAFRHDAVSFAGATGLMQVMPATGGDIAKSLKMNSYDLKDPEVSILFGFYYMDWLRRIYEGEFDQMLGGYNAGPGNMNKWKKSFDVSDKIFFAEKVPFDETRFYMFKNQKYLIQYNTVYGEKGE
ncbi:MAG: transglycosylase SLT domain-containing protein [Spirochaetes bacterium]|nr:transglycosylase SLT domain-containing protein [Spirochaetota bacterium]MBN2772499.1 transglycosylase SLT domain-containing protein [Spirochaetota bacterium]